MAKVENNPSFRDMQKDVPMASPCVKLSMEFAAKLRYPLIA